ncbi:MAG TPA: N-acetylmuramoyl-L-alanine amidase, partial [Caldilineae bacterium]|nr:N-acetylmuramoyl-L-alanine amidase [Caldilineae bacterium]
MAVPAIVQIPHRLPRHAAELHTRTADEIEHIVISHTGVRPGVAIERVAQAHLKRWPAIACHFLVEADGSIYQTCAVSEAVDDQLPWIYHGVIVYAAGNFNDVIPPDRQLDALASLNAWLLNEYKLSVDKIIGASELLRTQSPGKQWLEGQCWKDLLLTRVTALLGDRAGDGGTKDTGRETDKSAEPAGKTTYRAGAGVRRQVKVRAQTVARPEVVDLVSQLPTHPLNRYETRALTQITHIAIHHSAAPASVTPQRIAHHHVFAETQQWPGMGYHYFISADGTIQHTQSLAFSANHVYGHNRETVGVCLAGNFDHSIPTLAQLAATGRLVAWLMTELDIPLHNVWGHKAFPRAATSCPGAQWDSGQRWQELLLREIRTALNLDDDPTTKLLDHYLLLQPRPGTEEACERVTANYIARFRPTSGFSLTTAMMARRVTLVACAPDQASATEELLRQAGCQVERIPGRDLAEIRQTLDRLAESGQRSLIHA